MIPRLIHWYHSLSPKDKETLREWLWYAIIIISMAALPFLALLGWRLYDRWQHPEFYLNQISTTFNQIFT